MVDEVTGGLKESRRETNVNKRFELFERLADTHDPRVAVELAGIANNPADDWGELAGLILCWHYADLHPSLGSGRKSAQVWWKKHEADLRRRAKQLPQ